MPGTAPNTLPKLFHLLPHKWTSEGGYDYLHFIKEDTEAREIRQLGKGHKGMRIATEYSQMPQATMKGSHDRSIGGTAVCLGCHDFLACFLS